MTDNEKIVLDETEFEQLTENQKEQYIKSLDTHKTIAIEKLNKLLKELSIRGKETELEIYKKNDTKKVQKVNRPGNIKNLPQTIKGPEYSQILDKTNFPKST